ncbi:MAG: gliding motility-associated C-terminal domain-containing protein [Bacteroidetes bacterium]|nr:gliding motility-associated C-terminal domain-containing protein [Bacteroidota bacterium]
MYKYLLLIVFLYCGFVKAQINLVPNPGFENYALCPVAYSGVEYNTNTFVENWIRPTGGSSDYFNECATLASYVDIPANYFMNYQPARTGVAYAGGYAFYQSFHYREYIQVELIEPMIAEECYYVEYYTAPAETVDGFLGSVATDRIGLYISVERPLGGGELDYETLELEPQIFNPLGSFITDTLGWIKVSGVYIAEGGEEWITIGNFFNDGETEYIEFVGSVANAYSYYVYDDFLVTPLTAINVLHDSILCAGETLTLSMYEGGISYLWNTGDTSASISVNETGNYSVIAEYSCGVFYDSAYVVFNIDSNYTSEDYQEICYTELPYIIEGSPIYTVYIWDTGDTTQNITITSEGTYILHAYGGCSSFTDTFTISVFEFVPDAIGLDDTLLICEVNGNAELNGPDGFDNYSWNSGETTQSITVNTDGNYTLTYSKDCDTYSHTFTVISDPYLLTEFNLLEEILLCTLLEPFVILDAGAVLPNYYWNTGETMQTIQVNTPGIYTVSSTTLCTEKTASINVISCEVMTVPNAFSPNDDGINDWFTVLCEPCSDFISLSIYDRWGNLLFETHDYTLGWNGKHNYNDSEMGSYTYLLRYAEDGIEKVKSGSFTLVR